MGPQKKWPFDKYKLYHGAVQSPETDVRFYLNTYKKLIGKSKSKMVLREDFCAAGAISCEWVKMNPSHYAFGVDLDLEPMNYGRENYISKLSKAQQDRIFLVHKNVLDRNLPKADVSVGVNFSYFLFKERETLHRYFSNVYQHLNKNGLFLVDVFGGTHCTDSITDKTKLKNYTYYWDQKSFDPITNYADFGIHFKYKNKIYKDVFTYEWRMWSIPEIREIMKEAGFSETKVFWEGTNRLGNGNGQFTMVEKGEPCLSWIAYVVGVKKA